MGTKLYKMIPHYYLCCRGSGMEIEMNNALSAKERIMATLLNMLSERKDITKLTTREIAALSDVNTAMINYYYQSKENLLNLAVNQYMSNAFEEIVHKSKENGEVIFRLKTMIKAVADAAIQNFSSSEIAILFDFKNGSIETNNMITPLLKEHFGDIKSDDEIKVIGLQIIIPLQMLFLNEKSYSKYFTLDIKVLEERNQLIDCIIENVIH